MTPGVHRADGHLVDLLALARGRSRSRPIGGRRRAAGARRRLEADRLQPRMARGRDAPLLGDLALEPVRLRAVGRQRGVARPPTSAASSRSIAVVRSSASTAQQAHAAVPAGRPRTARPGARRPRRRRSGPSAEASGGNDAGSPPGGTAWPLWTGSGVGASRGLPRRPRPRVQCRLQPAPGSTEPEHQHARPPAPAAARRRQRAAARSRIDRDAGGRLP